MNILLIEQNKLIMYSLLIVMMVLIIVIIIIDRKAKKSSNDHSEGDFIFKIEDNKVLTHFNDLTGITEEQKASYELNQIKSDMITNENHEIEVPHENISLTDFEQKQETSAIISYEDLVKKADTLYQENDVTNYQDEGNEPINILDLNKPKEAIKVEQKELVLDDFILPEEELGKKAFMEKTSDEVKKFTNTPFISPIYGMEKATIVDENEPPIITNSSYEKLDEELRKMNEFLNMLKDLEKKLNYK